MHFNDKYDEIANNGGKKCHLKWFNAVDISKGSGSSTQLTYNLKGLVVGAPYQACAIEG